MYKIKPAHIKRVVAKINGVDETRPIFVAIAPVAQINAYKIPMNIFIYSPLSCDQSLQV